MENIQNTKYWRGGGGGVGGEISNYCAEIDDIGLANQG